MHNRKNELHEQKAIAAAALGAFTGYSKKGKKGAATGAVLGGLAGLFAGKKALNSI